jgi:esterase/lipase superfamily enzyme
MPAMLDYTTKTTGVSSVSLMAHSQGTSQTFYGITEN